MVIILSLAVNRFVFLTFVCYFREWVKWSLYGSLKLTPIYWQKVVCPDDITDLVNCSVYNTKTDTLLPRNLK